MRRKVLLAEDSLTIRKVFELVLSPSDAALTMVDDGEDAVRMAGELSPDLVIADVTLPGRDGFEVAAALCSPDRAKPVPVLLLAGSLNRFDEEKFRKSGAKGVLFKPFEAQELVEKIEEVLREGAEKPAEEKPAGRPADEPWDFSDVLEEVEAASGKGAAPQKTPREEIPGLALAMPAESPGAVSLGEFDVSLEEIQAPRAREPEPEAHIAPEDAAIDAPQAVTDITPALEAVEEVEEIEDIEEMEPLKDLAPPAPPAETPEPAAEAVPSPQAGEPVPSAAAPPVEAAGPAVPPRPDEAQAPVARAVAPAPSADAAEKEFRERFAARAEEIFERAAAEAVEKVLWEHMDRLAAEFSARIRESVESVSWEVIPATAEALIREEIARIRSLGEKKAP